MAEGGYDPERIDPREMRKALEEIETRNRFRNPVYEEEDDEEFNTSTRSKLSTDYRFEPGRAPSPELTVKVLQHSNMEDWLDYALSMDKRSWKGATKTGKRLLSARLMEEPKEIGKLVVYYEANDGKTYEISQVYDKNQITSMKDLNKVFSEKNPGLVEEIKNILYTPDEPQQEMELLILHQEQKFNQRPPKLV